MPPRSLRPGVDFQHPVRTLRDFFGIASQVLAVEAGIHPTTLSRIENGRLEPKVSTAIAICEALARLASDECISGASFDVESLFGADGSLAEWMIYEEERARDDRRMTKRLRERQAMRTPGA